MNHVAEVYSKDNIGFYCNITRRVRSYSRNSIGEWPVNCVDCGEKLTYQIDESKKQFITKDSGQREEFTNGAVRDTRTGKGRFDLIPAAPLKRLADVYERGATKYSDNNWRRGIPLSRCMDSALRHLNQYKNGDRDEDHLAQAAWNIFAMMWYEGTEWDNSKEMG